jgi:hypothetical protein
MNQVRVVFVAFGISVAAIGCSGSSVDDENGASSASALVGYTGVGNCPSFDDFSVCLCEDGNLHGYCQIYSLFDPFDVNSSYQSGNYPNPGAFATLRNDKVSSFALGGYTAFKPYIDSNYTQSSFFNTKPEFSYTPNTAPNTPPQAQNFDDAWNDEMSSFILFRVADLYALYGSPPSATSGKVALFEDGNYSGRRVMIGPGDYPNDNWAPGTNSSMGSFGLSDNTLSSIRIGSGVHVVLWRDPAVIVNGQLQYSGPSVVVTSDSPDLGASHAFNDQASAIQVIAN